MNELQQMKMQIAQMMNMMKQKDQIIYEQNEKLVQNNNGYGIINSLNNMNNMATSQNQRNNNMAVNQQYVPNNMQMNDNNRFLGYQQNYNQYVPNNYQN